MSTDNLTPRGVRQKATTGDPDSAIFNMFYGPSHTGSADLVQINQDVLGYVFITKPNCNMSKGNIAKVRKLYNLADEDPNSLSCAIKCSMSTKHYWDVQRDGIRSNAVNDDYAFIPFLSTSLESLSGWPDEAMEFFESEEGWAKEVYGWADGRPESFSTFDLQFTFNSKEGDPHGAFFTAMHQYMGHVGIGTINPLGVSEIEFEIDYAQNVYVILMDRTKKFVHKIACLNMGGFWMGTNNGAQFNVEKGPSVQLGSRQISVPMRCFGFLYNDPAIVDRFNKTVGNFKFDMFKIHTDEEHKLVKIPSMHKAYYFNNRGYPFINPNTSELEWWIEQDVYDAILKTAGVNND
ncbi:virion structural protein [Vibrio phage C-ZP2022]|nr:virion structural protein [Vibrio phage C-ZP2022]